MKIPTKCEFKVSGSKLKESFGCYSEGFRSRAVIQVHGWGVKPSGKCLIIYVSRSQWVSQSASDSSLAK